MANFTFYEIPTDWRSPGTYLEVKPNYRNVGIFDYPVQNLIIGAKLTAGTLQPGTIVEVVRGTEGQALFGIGSIGAEQAQLSARRIRLRRFSSWLFLTMRAQ